MAAFQELIHKKLATNPPHGLIRLWRSVIILETSMGAKAVLQRLSHLSFKEPLFDLLNSHGGKQPFKGDCRNNEDDDNCFCRIEIEDRQLKALLKLLFSLSYGWLLGSCCTAEIFSASGSMQLHIEPTKY